MLTRDECANEACKWVGSDDDKLEVIDKESTRETGVEIKTLACPQCGQHDFFMRDQHHDK